MPSRKRSPETSEALRALRERLDATQEAARRLAEDAARDRPPPRGWDVPRSAERTGEELDALVALIASLRDLLPPELRAQLAELARQLVLFVRAVLDWWIERLERESGGGEPEVEDIPIR